MNETRTVTRYPTSGQRDQAHGYDADISGVIEHCAQCLQKVEDGLGYATSNVETLCGPCYFALWGPRGAAAISRSTERRRPDTRRPPPSKTRWIPGPTGELDPQEALRRRRRRRRMPPPAEPEVTGLHTVYQP